MREPRGRNATGGPPQRSRAHPADASDRQRPASRSISAAYASATAPGEAAASTHSRPRRPISAAPTGSSTRAAMAVVERVGVVGRHADTAARLGEQGRHRGAGVDRGDERPAGGERRVRLRRHADVGQAAVQRDDVDVAGGEQLDEAPFGHVAPEADVGQSGGIGTQLGQPGALAVDQEGDVRQAAGRVEQQRQRLREPDVAGVEHHRLVADAELAAVGRQPVGRVDAAGVDEVGDDVHRRRRGPPAACRGRSPRGRRTAR